MARRPSSSSPTESSEVFLVDLDPPPTPITELVGRSPERVSFEEALHRCPAPPVPAPTWTPVPRRRHVSSRVHVTRGVSNRALASLAGLCVGLLPAAVFALFRPAITIVPSALEPQPSAVLASAHSSSAAELSAPRRPSEALVAQETPDRAPGGRDRNPPGPNAVRAARAVTQTVSNALALPQTPGERSVLAAIQAVRADAKACVHPKHGHAMVRITAVSDGRVVDTILSGPFAGTEEGQCVLRALRGVRFEPFSKPEFEIEYVFRF